MQRQRDLLLLAVRGHGRQGARRAASSGWAAWSRPAASQHARRPTSPSSSPTTRPTTRVVYHGDLPDLFREGQGIVAAGLVPAGPRLPRQPGAGQARRDLHAARSRRPARRNKGEWRPRAAPRQASRDGRQRATSHDRRVGAFALVLALALSVAPDRAVGGRRGCGAARVLAGRGEGAAIAAALAAARGLRGADPRLRRPRTSRSPTSRPTPTPTSRCSTRWPAPGAATRARCCCGAWS